MNERPKEYIVKARYSPPELPRCPNCEEGGHIRKNNIRRRTIPDSPVRGKQVTILLSSRNYKCDDCQMNIQIEVPDLMRYSKMTKRLAIYIIRACMYKNHSEISRETGVSESTVSEIFTKFVESNGRLLTRKTPRVLGMGEVMMGRVTRCLLTDIENKKPFDIVSRCTRASITEYLRDLKNSNRVEIVTMPLHAPFRDAVKSALPHAKILLDKFYFQSKANEAIKSFLAETRKPLRAAERRKLMRDPFLLLRRASKLTDDDKAKLALWKSEWSELAEIYDLKEEYFEIWNLSDRDAAAAQYEEWKNKMSSTAREAYQSVTQLIGNWYEEVFNFFDYRVTNSYTGSCRVLLNMMQSEGRSYDYETLRIKFLYQNAVDDDFPDESINLEGFSEKTEKLTRTQRLRKSQSAETID